MPLNNQNLTSKTSLLNVLEALRNNINYNLNCVKVATVDTFFPEDLTVSCVVANKRVVGLKNDGNQELKDYPLIYAKVHFFGWGTIGATYPITKGMEGLLLFNDREIETWFLTGQGGNLAYDRNHNLSDAIFICGIHSLPHMIEILTDCLHIYNLKSDIQLKEEEIISNTPDLTINVDNEIETNSDTVKSTVKTSTTITSPTINTTSTTGVNITTPLVDVTGNITASSVITGTGGLVDSTAATGTFTSDDGKLITVVNGIVKQITG